MELKHAVGIFSGEKLTKAYDAKEAIALADHLLKSPMEPVDTHYRAALVTLRQPEFHDALRLMNLAVVKHKIASAVNEDTLIIQTINAIEDLDLICNTLSKRLREWYGYHFPEAGYHMQDHAVFIKRILQDTKENIAKEYNIHQSMGADLPEKDITQIMQFAKQADDLFLERERLINYLEEIMKTYCRNVQALVGTLIGAKLLEKAGSLRHLAFLPSSTIQLYGAEKALFRHLRNRKIRPPKHGLILSHPFVMDAKKQDRGSAARQLASKISIAAKVDYFKGEYIADKLKEELEKK